jgi:protein transport protein SEC13
MIHDSKLNYYGTKLATTSSDQTTKVYALTSNSQTLSATLTGHTGPVWGCDWSHPKFGNLLATCGFDGQVIIYREQQGGQWLEIKRWSAGESLFVVVVSLRAYPNSPPHLPPPSATDTATSLNAQAQQSSINHVEFAPHQHGLILACASSSGFVTLLTHQPDDSWTSSSFLDNSLGVNSLSFAPFDEKLSSSSSAEGGGQTAPKLRLVTGGCDNRLRFHSADPSAGSVWRADENPISSASVASHRDWVRDVAWAPTPGPASTVASCGEDGQVLIWDEKVTTPGNTLWSSTVLHDFGAAMPVWRVSWSVTGNVLAVSAGEGDVSLWKVDGFGKWGRVASVEDMSAGTGAGVVQQQQM